MVEGVGVLLLFWPVSKEGFLQPPGQWQALLGIPVLSRCIFFFLLCTYSIRAYHV